MSSRMMLVFVVYCFVFFVAVNDDVVYGAETPMVTLKTDILITPYNGTQQAPATCSVCPFVDVELVDGTCQPLVKKTYATLSNGVASVYYSMSSSERVLKVYLVTLDAQMKPECNDEENVALGQKKTLAKTFTIPNRCYGESDPDSGLPLSSVFKILCDFTTIQPVQECVINNVHCASVESATPPSKVCTDVFISSDSSRLSLYAGISASITAKECSNDSASAALTVSVAFIALLASLSTYSLV